MTIKSKKADFDFWTYDIEPITINNELFPFAVGLFTGYEFYYFYLDENLNYTKLINDSLDFIFAKIKSSSYIYIHNMDRFDSIFLIKYVNSLLYKTDIFAHNNHIYKIKITNGHKVIHFTDSYKIIQMKLSDAGEAFNVAHKKKEIDFTNFVLEKIFNINIKDEIVLYLKYDCMCLYEILILFFIEIYYTYNIKFYKFLTISSLALQIWEFYNNKNKKYIIENNSINTNWKDDFIRKAYFGGRCEIFKPHIKNGYYYDINSFYPFIMLNNEFPINDGKFIVWDNEKFILEEFFGFLYCEIISPLNIYYPVLPYKSYNKLIYYPKGIWKGTYFIAELLLAKKYGYIINPIHGIQYLSKAKIFEQCIEDLYKKRVESSLNISPIYKLIMNSLSGRFGMHSYNIKQEILNENELDLLLETRPKKVINATYIDDNKYYVELKKSLKYQKQSSVQISAAITSYARVHLYELFIYLKELNINIYYTDTDSIVTDYKIPNKLCGKELGKFKLVNLIEEGFFLNQKIYYIFYNQLLIKKFKGVNSELLQNLTPNDLINFLINDEINVLKFNNVLRINRSLKNFNITKHNLDMLFYLKYNKRHKIYDENNIWYDTIPIIIN